MNHCPVTQDCLRYAAQIGADEAAAEEVQEILAEAEFNPWTPEHINEAMAEYLCDRVDAETMRDDSAEFGRLIREQVLKYWAGAAVTEQQHRVMQRQYADEQARQWEDA